MQRCDGRAPDALRPVAIERDCLQFADGSAMVDFGATRVLCAASFQDRVPAWLEHSGQGWVTAEYAMLPAATHPRGRRDNASGGRAREISRLIGRSLRAVTDLRALGPCQITLDCDVLQADGGTRTAAITGAFVALYDALRGAVAAGHLAAVPVSSRCAAVSVGLVDGQPLLDLCYEEDARADVDMNIVMDAEGRFIEVQGAAETAPFSREPLNAMLDLAARGVAALEAKQREVLDIE